MRINIKLESIKTYEGAPAKRIKPIDELRRTVMACMLWENQFYEDGISIADRIANLIKSISDNDKIAQIASEARNRQHLRHVPLLIARELARKKGVVIKDLLADIIQRPDELCEFLALYWMDGKQPLSHQVKKGLAIAFKKFSEYQISKYNRPDAIKLKDVLFMVHPKPKDDDQQKVWDRLVEDKLTIPDTWEVRLSGGQDKHEAWIELIKERKLGGLAYLRNLRNMIQAKVSDEIISEGLKDINVSKVLPFRFITAAKYAPNLEKDLESLMIKGLNQQIKLSGKTILIVDVSGSMYGSSISNYSEMDRAHAACSLAILTRELCEDIKIYATAGNDSTEIHQTEMIPSRHGFALSDKIYSMCKPLGGGGIFLTPVLRWIKEREEKADRIIVITDEQDCARSNKSDSPLKADTFGKNNYMINVASMKNGIGYDKWVHIDGFSEAVINYIREYERIDLQ